MEAWSFISQAKPLWDFQTCYEVITVHLSVNETKSICMHNLEIPPTMVQLQFYGQSLLQYITQLYILDIPLMDRD